jgi:hypothetical protein
MSHIKICRSLLLVFSTITKSLKAATEFAISSCCVQSPQRDKEREAAKNWEEIQRAHNKSRTTFSVCTWHGPPRTRNIHSRIIHSWNIQTFHSWREYLVVPFMQGIFIHSIHSRNIHSFVPFIDGIFNRSIHSFHSFTEYSFVPQYSFVLLIPFIPSLVHIFVLCPQRRSESESAPLDFTSWGDGCGWMVTDFSLVPIPVQLTHVWFSLIFKFFFFSALSFPWI